VPFGLIRHSAPITAQACTSASRRVIHWYVWVMFVPVFVIVPTVSPVFAMMSVTHWVSVPAVLVIAEKLSMISPTPWSSPSQ
jgi:hypothetical protein